MRREKIKDKIPVKKLLPVFIYSDPIFISRRKINIEKLKFSKADITDKKEKSRKNLFKKLRIKIAKVIYTNIAYMITISKIWFDEIDNSRVPLKGI